MTDDEFEKHTLECVSSVVEHAHELRSWAVGAVAENAGLRAWETKVRGGLGTLLHAMPGTQADADSRRCLAALLEEKP